MGTPGGALAPPAEGYVEGRLGGSDDYQRRSILLSGAVLLADWVKLSCLGVVWSGSAVLL